MKILVSGAAGFIGRHVLRHLADHEVLKVDSFEPRVHGAHPDTSGFLNRSCGFLFPEEIHDVDVVIHLAAQVGVADSMTNPLRYIHDNVVETALMLEHLEEYAAPKRIVVASSMSVYGDPLTPEPIGEEWFTAPASVYGLTKLDQERLVMMLAPLMGATPIALRFFNVYGPGQALHNPYTGVLANFANNLLRGDAPIVYEDGLQTRDFIYVEDVAQAVVAAALHPGMEGVYNVCTGHAQSILGVAQAMCEVLAGGMIEPDVTYEVRPGDIRHCVGRNLKLRLALPSWEPRPFAEGLDLYASHLLASTQG